MVVSGDSMSDDWSSTLTHREREVALLIARGLTNKEIARELGLSVGTVKLHVHSIFLKLGMRSRHMLIFLASGRAVA
jgi:two-component system, NarL family, nitrate/nitrite response regulator NarL